MNKVLKCLVPGLITVLITAGCSRQPHQEMDSAKNAVDTAMAEGAQKYDPEGAKKLNSELNNALAEVKIQSQRFLGDYKKAKELLSKTKTDAEEVKAGLAAKKEALKRRAYESRESATSALDNAEVSISGRTKSKKTAPGTDADLVDFQVLKKAMDDVQELLDNEDYLAAATKAESVRDKALALSDRTKKAPDKDNPEKTNRWARKKKNI